MIEGAAETFGGFGHEKKLIARQRSAEKDAKYEQRFAWLHQPEHQRLDRIIECVHGLFELQHFGADICFCVRE